MTQLLTMTTAHKFPSLLLVDCQLGSRVVSGPAGQALGAGRGEGGGDTRWKEGWDTTDWDRVSLLSGSSSGEVQ